MVLTPEMSMAIQNKIGADIMMALDDVVHSTTTGPRVEEAMNSVLMLPLHILLTTHPLIHSSIHPLILLPLDMLLTTDRFTQGRCDGWTDA